MSKLFLPIIAVRMLLLSQITHSFTIQSNIIAPQHHHSIQQDHERVSTNDNNRLLPLFFASSTPSSPLPSSQQEQDTTTTTIIQSTTLKQLYPRLVAWKEEYGNPNIPLGTEGGRQCQLLRRLHMQQKLHAGDVDLLKKLGFQFSLSLEDLYWDADFDDMVLRLQVYQKLHPEEATIPKKYRPDPELGAWATGVRRLGPNNVKPEHARQLVSLGFEWESSRPCGSKFMLRYREIVHDVQLHGTAILETPETQSWISKQRVNRMRSKMSDTRYHYMVDLLGEHWME